VQDGLDPRRIRIGPLKGPIEDIVIEPPGFVHVWSKQIKPDEFPRQSQISGIRRDYGQIDGRGAPGRTKSQGQDDQNNSCTCPDQMSFMEHWVNQPSMSLA
jgi:hypothetical protein